MGKRYFFLRRGLSTSPASRATGVLKVQPYEIKSRAKTHSSRRGSKKLGLKFVSSIGGQWIS
jgi:hypothetical protein